MLHQNRLENVHKNSESETKKEEKRFKARLLFQRVAQNFILQRQISRAIGAMGDWRQNTVPGFLQFL